MILLALLLAVAGLPVAQLPAFAAGAPIVSGTISIDSDNDGTLDTSTNPGEKDTPLAGVDVTLVCVADSAELTTVTTGADGKYEFGDGDLGACAGPVKVRLTTGNSQAVHATEPASADNGFARVTPTRGETSPLAPSAATPVTFNGLVFPAWKSNLALAPDEDGWQDLAVKTGAPTFDASEAEAGWDSAADNDVVRAGDAVTYTFNATFSSVDPLADSVTSAILEQVINLDAGAVANFARIPAVCTGTNPASSIKAMPSGTVIAGSTVPPAGTTSVVLTCNIGAIGDERQALLPSTAVWVSATSANGSTFTTTARLYGVDADGDTTIQPSPSVENGPIKITSQPRFDLVKKSYTLSGLTTTNIGGVTTPGYFVYWHVYVTTDRKVGVEAPKQPITFSEDFLGQYNSTSSAGTMGNTVSGLKYYLTQCISSTDGVVYGKKASYPNNTNQSVSDSGTCTYTRDAANDTAPYTVTLNGIDTSGAHYPTVDRNGSSLAAGPFYVAAYRMQVFVPLTEVDRATGAPADGAGSLSVSNQVGDFEPTEVSGTSNYGSGVEPGYCTDGTPTADDGTLEFDCDLMEDGTRSNNVAGPQTLTVSPGTWAKYNFDLPTGWVHSEALLPGSGASHDGAATLQPGQTGASDIRIGNGGAAPMTGIMMCDVFDNTTMKLTTLDKVVNNAASFSGAYDLSTRHAYVLYNSGSIGNNAAGWATNLAYQDNWEIQYAHFDLGSDNPIGGGFVATYNRYNGTWTNQRTASCADGATENRTGWVTSVAAAGGIDAVNGIRVVAKNGYGLPSAHYAHLKIAYEQRDTFNGGPNAGAKIPSGTVAANFARVRSDSLLPNWNARSYIPMSTGGESGHSDGDRWTVTRAEMNLKKRTITVDGVGTGAADYGNTGTAIAGNKVVWEVVSTLTAAAQDPAPVGNVVITDVLPKYSIYNEQCTAGLTGGTPATTYTVNADGTTTLVWNLGTLTPNQNIPNRRICTDSDPLAPNGTTLVNKAEITSPDVTPVSAHKDDHTVVLEQTGELRLKKEVDQVLDLEDQDQQYTLRLKNFSDTVAVQRPTVIDVLSYNGDATSAAGVNRSPKSDYVGTNGLTGPVTAYAWDGTTPVTSGTVYYTTAAGASVPQNLNDDTNPAIWTTSITDWSTVTAFKYVAGSNLAVASNPNASGLVLKYTTKQATNDPGDIYANRFTAFSNTFTNAGRFQLLTSNQTTVRVVGFSLGDLIWTDEDFDGKFTAGTDTPAPEGVTVNVYNEANVLVASTTTNDQGRWIVNDLSTGKYYAVIPAAEFAAAGLLAKRVPAPAPATDPETNRNEGDDHHAIADGGGVRSSGLIELNAVVNGSVITGQEPGADNVGGLLVSPGTTDDFTNLTLDLALNRVPGYTFVKAASPASTYPVVVDDTITYTLTGTSTGSMKLDPVQIKDNLADVLAHADLVSGSLEATITGPDAPASTPAATLSGNDLSWTGTLTEGQVITVTYQVKVKQGAQGKTLKNAATSTAKPLSGETISGQGAAEHPVAGFTFTKVPSPADGRAVPVGGEITYTLTGTNTGATTLDTEITDNLAQVLNNADLVGAASATVNGAVVTAPVVDTTAKTLAWNGELPIGGVVTVTYTVKVKAGAEGKTIANSAIAVADPPHHETITTGPVVTKHPVPGFTFTKTSDPATTSTVLADDEITYTLTGTNTGATGLDPVVVTDDLTEVLKYAELVAGSLKATIDGTATTAPTLSGDILNWTGALAEGEKVVVTYTVKIKSDASGKTLANTASATATPPDGVAPIVGNGAVTHPVGGFVLAKVSDPVTGTPVPVGGSIGYTVTGTNTGASVLDPVVITDDLSAVLDRATIVAGSLSATVDGETATAPTLSDTTLTWSGQLPAGAVVVLKYRVTVSPESEGSVLVNTVTGSATPPGKEPIKTEPVSTRHPVPGFSFSKVSDPVSGEVRVPGETITYTLSGKNTGATVLDPVTVTDDLSTVLAHATLVAGSLKAEIAGSPAPNAPVLSGTTLTWTGALDVEQSVTITYQVTVNASARGVVLTNTATASATPPGITPLVPPAVSTQHPTPGFTFVKVADPVSGDAVLPGQKVTYTLTGSNNGKVTLDPVTLTDNLSGVLAYADLDPSSLIAKIGATTVAAPVVSGTTLTWAGVLKAGETVKVTYVVTVKTGVTSPTSILKNKATASATPAGKPAIVPAEQSTSHPIAGYTMVKLSDPPTGTEVDAGTVVTYTVRGTNTGASTLTGVTISDDLSEVFRAAKLKGAPVATIKSADGTATTSTATLTGSVLGWSGALAVGQVIELTYQVEVSEVSKATSLHNVATATWVSPGQKSTALAPIETDNPVEPVVEADGDGDNLALTGAAGVGGALIVGLLALLVGAALLVARRRETGR